MISPSKSCATHCGAATSRMVFLVMSFLLRYEAMLALRPGHSKRRRWVMRRQKVALRRNLSQLQSGLIDQVAVRHLVVKLPRIQRLIAREAGRAIGGQDHPQVIEIE